MISSLASLVSAFDCSPWSATTGRRVPLATAHSTILPGTPALLGAGARSARNVGGSSGISPLYNAAERRRRDATPWTLVQGILAPAQFAAFAVSLALVMRFVATGAGYEAATLSILVKTGFLAAIMVTGAMWEKAVFGRYLFAPAFFWEDLFSFLVIALHAGYVVALVTHGLSAPHQMLLALTAYAAYVVNAAQFVVKMRRARLEAPRAATVAFGDLSEGTMGEIGIGE